MFGLMFLSAFFSSAEAAFFSLNRFERKRLAQGGRFSPLVIKLSEHPERLLAAILWGNLLVNLLVFTISTVIVFQLQQRQEYATAGFFAFGSLITVILFCEMFPKDLAVLNPRFFAVLWALPLSVILRFLQPVLPLFETANLLSRRVFWPDFRPEPYLRLGDLEQAINLSKDDATLLRREQNVLQSIVRLSNVQAEELMWPRAALHFFKPPVTLEDVVAVFGAELPKTGFLLIAEKNGEELASAVPLRRFQPEAEKTPPAGNLKRKTAPKSTTRVSTPEKESVVKTGSPMPVYSWDENSAPVCLVPWSLSAAEVLDLLEENDREVAAVLNEYGETVGVLTRDDLLDFLFGRQRGRSRKLFNRASIRQVGPDLWQVTGLTSLKRLERRFGIALPSQASLTVAGLLQERLERLPLIGDVCRFKNLEFRVIDSSDEEGLVVEIRGLRGHAPTQEPGTETYPSRSPDDPV